MRPDQDGNFIGNLFYGTEGWMSLQGNGFRAYRGESREKFLDEPGDDSSLPHVINFLDAVRSRDYHKLHADIEVAVYTAALAHIANASYRTGRKLAVDPKQFKFLHDTEANDMLTREYRAPYVVPSQV